MLKPIIKAYVCLFYHKFAKKSICICLVKQIIVCGGFINALYIAYFASARTPKIKKSGVEDSEEIAYARGVFLRWAN